MGALSGVTLSTVVTDKVGRLVAASLSSCASVSSECYFAGQSRY